MEKAQQLNSVLSTAAAAAAAAAVHQRTTSAVPFWPTLLLLLLLTSASSSSPPSSSPQSPPSPSHLPWLTSDDATTPTTPTTTTTTSTLSASLETAKGIDDRGSSAAATESPPAAAAASLTAASAITIILPQHQQSASASVQLALESRVGNGRWCPQKCTCTVEGQHQQSRSTAAEPSTSAEEGAAAAAAAAAKQSIWSKLMTASGFSDVGGGGGGDHHHQRETTTSERRPSAHPKPAHHHLPLLLLQLRVDCTSTGLSTLNATFWQQFQPQYDHHQQQSTSSRPLARPLVSSLILSSNEISTLHRHHFESITEFQHSSLRRLHLDGNRLTELLNDTFSALHSLEHLNLAFNRLSRLEPNCFRGLSRLFTLDLSGNQLKVFPSHQLQPALLNQLAEVNLRQNQISWIPEEAFNGGGTGRVNGSSKTTTATSSQLVKFDLSENPLLGVHSRAFINLRHLRRLYLSSLEHQEHTPSLANCDSLEHIKVDRSQLTSIDGALCRQVGGTAKSLVLKSNRISQLPASFHLCTELRVLDLSYNELPSLGANRLLGQGRLIDLSLQYNQIAAIEQSAFAGLSSLQVLNLEGNRIVAIHGAAFVPLVALQDINLGHNLFSTLPTAGLGNLLELKVHGNRHLRDFPPAAAFPYVATLALSYAYHCCPFVGRLQRTRSSQNHDSTNSFPSSSYNDSILWPEDTDPSKLNETIFELTQQISKQYGEGGGGGGSFNQEELLAAIETPTGWDGEEGGAAGGHHFEHHHQNYRVYIQPGHPTPQAPPLIRCLPAPGPFTPCKDLFDWWTLRFAVWLVFPLALLGNGTVLLVLIFGRRRRHSSGRSGSSGRRRKMDVPRFLVCNLAAADLLMGVYLGALALVDASTLGAFRAHALRWQHSLACQLTGFTGVLSTELSVFTLAVITLERNYAITHAMHLNKRLSLRAASSIMAAGWALALALALLPLFGISDYRKFAVCLPLEAEDSPWSLLYVVALLAINGLSFLLLLGCYLRMYCAIRGSQAWNSNDTRIAMRMGLLVATDFACYAPIAFFSATALLGYRLISLEEAKVFTVFVLPLNACMDPFLYAVFSRQFKKECGTLYRRVEAFTSPVTGRCKCFTSGSVARSATIAKRGGGGGGGGRNPEGTFFVVQKGRGTREGMVVASGGDKREQPCKVCGHRPTRVLKAGAKTTATTVSAQQIRQQSIHSLSSQAIGTAAAALEQQCFSEGGGGGKVATVLVTTKKEHHEDEEEEEEEDNDEHKEEVVVLQQQQQQLLQHCKCHCHLEENTTCRGQQPPPSSEGEDSDQRTSAWSAGQLVRSLFFIKGPASSEHNKSSANIKGGGPHPSTTRGAGAGAAAAAHSAVVHSSSSTGLFNKHRRSVTSSVGGGGISTSGVTNNPGKQFKSNSIIYQSNYRKNHVHMMLENEVVGTAASAASAMQQQQQQQQQHPKLARYSSDILDTRKAKRIKQQQQQQTTARKISTPSGLNVCISQTTAESDRHLSAAAAAAAATTKCEMEGGSKSSDNGNGQSNGGNNNNNNEGAPSLKLHGSHKAAAVSHPLDKAAPTAASGGPLASSSAASSSSAAKQETAHSKVNNSNSTSEDSSISAGKMAAAAAASNRQSVNEEFSCDELEEASSSGDYHLDANQSSSGSGSGSGSGSYIKNNNSSNNNNNNNNSNSKGRTKTIYHQRVTATPSNTSAMASGILALKNKLISRSSSTKNYTRKTSSDSQYEFSYYGRRESSSTTGRTSFSSDAATKSTSVETAETAAVGGGGGGGGSSGTAGEPTVGEPTSTTKSLAPAPKTWEEIEEEIVEDEQFDSLDLVDNTSAYAPQNNSNGNNNIKLQSSSHERILSFLQILLPKSAKLGGGGGGNSGHSSAGSTSTSGRKSAEKGGGGKNKKSSAAATASSSAALINTTRRSSSAYVLGEEHHSHLFHKCSPKMAGNGGGGSQQLCVQSCSQLQVVAGGATSSAEKSTTSSKSKQSPSKRRLGGGVAEVEVGEGGRCRSAEGGATISTGVVGGSHISGSSHIIIIRSASPNLSHHEFTMLSAETPEDHPKEFQHQQQQPTTEEFSSTSMITSTPSESTSSNTAATTPHERQYRSYEFIA